MGAGVALCALDEGEVAHLERILRDLVDHSRLRAAHEVALVVFLIEREDAPLRPADGRVARTAAPRDPELDRWALSEELADLGTGAGPLVIVIDDLQDADSSSLSLLADLVPALRSATVLIVATARDGKQDWQGRQEAWGLLNGLGDQVRPCRELASADVVDGVISDMAVYCTGDWDEARHREHADTVTLIRQP